MTFYQELQLSSAGSKQLIKNTQDSKEKRRHILIYNFKVYLVMIFCVAVVTVFSKLLGNNNSVVGVTVLLAVLVLRQADFGIKTSHGLISIMGIYAICLLYTSFKGQFANVVEWEEYRDDIIFWKWTNREIKKGSKLIIRAGQDAIFMYNGKIEGIFKDEGSFDIESQIIPFLSTLKGFKFGFNSGVRAEVLFVNTKEFTEKWGTKNPILIPTQALPGGMPIRAFGNFSFSVSDYITLIDKVAGVKQMYTVADVKERISAVLDQLLMKWISKEGKDMFNLQANAYDLSLIHICQTPQLIYTTFKMQTSSQSEARNKIKGVSDA